MKRTIALVMAMLMALGTAGALAAGGDVKIRSNNFPDATFRAYVRKFDKNRDGRLSYSERMAVRRIDVMRMHIKSLIGIEHFSNLHELDASGNNIASIDLGGCPKLKKIIQTHIIVERWDNNRVLGWRLGYPHPLFTDSRTVLRDGRNVLYKPGRVRSIKAVKTSVTLKVGQLWLPEFSVTPSTAACTCSITVADDRILSSPHDDGTKKALKKGVTIVTIRTEYGQTARIRVTVN